VSARYNGSDHPTKAFSVALISSLVGLVALAGLLIVSRDIGTSGSQLSVSPMMMPRLFGLALVSSLLAAFLAACAPLLRRVDLSGKREVIGVKAWIAGSRQLLSRRIGVSLFAAGCVIGLTAMIANAAILQLPYGVGDLERGLIDPIRKFFPDAALI
jgi:hypothetical protein